jgi:Icc-related predicted phosphoesterase
MTAPDGLTGGGGSLGLFRSKPSTKASYTRVFFTTDVHGSEPAFLKFLGAASHYSAGVLVLGGDITGKMLISVIKHDGGWYAFLFGKQVTAVSESELADLENVIRTNGFYPYRTTPDEVAALEKDPERVDQLFSQLMKESVARWVQMTEDKLGGSGVKVYISLGNDDRDDLIPVLQGSKVVTYPDGRVVPLDDMHEMASVGYGNMTPWKCPRDLPEEELAKKIEEAVSGVRDMDHCVFNFHVPPYDTDLDLAPELDAELRPVLTAGQPNIVPVGSTAVRAAIERYQPLAGLHGHVHESRGVTKIGRTICINPGSEYSEGLLRGVLLNLKEGRVLSHQFVSG